MKNKISFFLSFVLCVLFFYTVSHGTENVTKAFPSAFLPENRYEFSTILEGEVITHDFIIQNKGTAPLKIEKVKSG